jgi:hypothetical protein
MSNGLSHVLHAIIVGFGLYVLMIFVLGQNSEIALNRSILISSMILIYMIIFGHEYPTQLNPNL